jgi:hypothetical protein
MGRLTAQPHLHRGSTEGHLVGVASTRYALPGTEDNVEVRGLIVEKFATPA